MVLASVAGNKVEGLALMKGMSIFMFAPVAAWFLDAPWRWLPALVPTTWPAEALWRSMGVVEGAAWWVLAVGIGYHVGLLWLLTKRLQARL